MAQCSVPRRKGLCSDKSNRSPQGRYSHTGFSAVGHFAPPSIQAGPTWLGASQAWGRVRRERSVWDLGSRPLVVLIVDGDYCHGACVLELLEVGRWGWGLWATLRDRGSAHAVLVRNEWKRNKLARWQVYSPSHSGSNWKAIERTEGLGTFSQTSYTPSQKWVWIKKSPKAPDQPPPLPRFKHKIRGGSRREGAATLSSPDRGKKRQLLSPPPRPPTKRRPGNQSGPLSRQGRLLGQRGRTRRPAPPPPTPNTCSQASPGAVPIASKEGGLRARTWKEFHPILGRGES